MSENYEHLEKQYNEMKARQEKMTVLEFTSDPANSREIVVEVIKALRGPDGKNASRERSLAITKLQEAQFWLLEAMMSENK